jgi:hypothetical protein
LREEAIRAVAVGAEAAGAVNKLRTKLQFYQSQQIGIGDDAVVWTKVRAATFALDLDSSQRSVGDKTVVAREGQQSRDTRLRQ